MARSRRRCRFSAVALLLVAAFVLDSGGCWLTPTAVLGPPRGLPGSWACRRQAAGLLVGEPRGGWRPQRLAAAAAEGTEEKDGDQEPEELPEDEEGLGRLKANAVAAWLVNITLVVWIVYLYQRAPSEDPSQEIITMLSQELANQSTALTSDRKLKEDLKQEAEALANIAKRFEDAESVKAAQQPLLAQLQSVLADRDAQLQQGIEATERDLRQVAERAEVQRQRLIDDSVLGPLTSSASGILAGIDVTIAAQFISLALLFSFATNRFRQGGQGAVNAAGAGAGAAGVGQDAADDERDSDERERDLRSKNVLRFYGRWDEDREWVLLQSVALKGGANTVIGSVRSARGWMGSWSDRLITSLVARSARGMVRRRGWKRIVEQTMDEVGRTFSLGYLVETAADKASARIEVDSKEKIVLEVPTSIVLEP